MNARYSHILLLLLVLTTVRGIFYITIFPPWLAPDEPAHFEAIRLIGQVGMWPDLTTYQQIPMHPEMKPSFEFFEIWQTSEHIPPFVQDNEKQLTFLAYYPAVSTAAVVSAEDYPLYYHFLLAPVGFVGQHLDLLSQVYLLRLVSLLFVLMTVITGWFLVRMLFPHSVIIPTGMLTFVIFLPMYLHVNTSINTDVAATLLASLYWLLLARIFVGHANCVTLLGAGIVFFAALLVKPTTLFIIPTTIAAALLFVGNKYRWSAIITVTVLFVLVVITFLGGIIFFTAAGADQLLSITTLSTAPAVLEQAILVDSGLLRLYAISIYWSLLSFWGLFGWANIHIPFQWLWWLIGIMILLVLGALIFIWRYVINSGNQDSRLSVGQRNMLLVLALGVVFALIQQYTPILATQSLSWGPPARYVFPALLPIALYLFLGFRQLIPGRWAYLTLPVWVISLIAYDSIVMVYVILPELYG
jgi:hypothetical protein